MQGTTNNYKARMQVLAFLIANMPHQWRLKFISFFLPTVHALGNNITRLQRLGLVMRMHKVEEASQF